MVARLVLGPAAEDLVETRMAWVDQVLEDRVSEGQVSAVTNRSKRRGRVALNK